MTLEMLRFGPFHADDSSTDCDRPSASLTRRSLTETHDIYSQLFEILNSIQKSNTFASQRGCPLVKKHWKMGSSKMNSFPNMIFEEILPFFSPQTLRDLSESDLEGAKKKSVTSRLRALKGAEFYFRLQGDERVVLHRARCRKDGNKSWNQWEKRKNYKNTQVTFFNVKGGDESGDKNAETVPVEELFDIANLPVNRSTVLPQNLSILNILHVKNPKEASVIAALARTVSPNYAKVGLVHLEGCADSIHTLLRRIVSSGKCRFLSICECDVNAETMALVKSIVKQNQFENLYLRGPNTLCSLQFLTEIVDFVLKNSVTKTINVDAANLEAKEEILCLIEERLNSGSEATQFRFENVTELLRIAFHVSPDRKRKRESSTVLSAIKKRRP